MVLTLATVQGIVAHLSAYDRASLQCICWLIFSVRSNCHFFATECRPTVEIKWMRRWLCFLKCCCER